IASLAGVSLIIILSNANPSSTALPSEPKLILNRTDGSPAKLLNECIALSQPALPLEELFLPFQPSWMPPGAQLMLLSLSQFSGSPNSPTLLQVSPSSKEYCKLAPSQLNSEFHQICMLICGTSIFVKSKQGDST